jgi:hypothetical protein
MTPDRRQVAARPSAAAGARAEGLGSLADVLDRVLTMGVVVDGAVTVGVAGVDLLLLDLRLLLAAVDTVRSGDPFFSAPPGDPPPAAPRPPAPPSPSAPEPSAPDASAPGPNAGPAPFTAAMLPAGAGPAAEDRQGLRNGLVRLVLTLVNLLHEVLERQAMRRMDNGTLTPAEIEAVGLALQAQAIEIARLRQLFGLDEADLTLRLSATG